jgi:hypothetical protein
MDVAAADHLARSEGGVGDNGSRARHDGDDEPLPVSELSPMKSAFEL